MKIISLLNLYTRKNLENKECSIIFYKQSVAKEISKSLKFEDVEKEVRIRHVEGAGFLRRTSAASMDRIAGGIDGEYPPKVAR